MIIITMLISLCMFSISYSCNAGEWIGANLLDGCNSCNQDCEQESSSAACQTSGAVNEISGAAGGF